MRHSLQVQLLAAVLIAESLLAVGLLIVGRHFLKEQLVVGLDSALAGRAMSVAALVRFSEEEPSTLVFDQRLVPQPLDAKFADAYEVLGPSSTVLGRSAYWPRDFGAATSFPSGFWTVRLGHHEFRGVRLDRVPILDTETGSPISPITLTVVYATRTHGMQNLLSSMTFSVGTAAFALVTVTGIFTAWFIRRSMSPLRKLANEAGGISAQQWKFAPPAEAERIAELRPLVKSLRAMVEGLRWSFESQRDFIANAAHELKTPVTIQKSSVQLLLHHDLKADEYKRGLEQVLRDTQRMEELLQRLLRLARAEHSATAPALSDLKPLSVCNSCETAVAQMQSFAESRGVLLQFAGEQEAYVNGDLEDLVLIWSNLLENAIRYSPKGGEVVLQVSTSGDQVKVTVQDSGCGVEPDQQKRIFERFYRGDQSRARDSGGIGLGLAMVKSLVERHRGTVHVDSEPSRGATFVVILPLHQFSQPVLSSN